jgi:cell fate (sporulation/competence/biofilm development) regulator YlbF (YheA/YmcA/DUF963 family)
LAHEKELFVADTNAVLSLATSLGNLIGAHPAVANYRSLTRQLDLDITARDLLGQFESLMETLAMKEQSMQPIEIAEKQQLQSLQQSIAIHPLLQRLMAGQREYMELMQKVQEAINAGVAQPTAAGAIEAEKPAAASKIILDS